MVMGAYLRSRGCEFKSQHRIPDESYFTFNCFETVFLKGHNKIIQIVLGRPNKEKLSTLQ